MRTIEQSNMIVHKLVFEKFFSSLRSYDVIKSIRLDVSKVLRRCRHSYVGIAIVVDRGVSWLDGAIETSGTRGAINSVAGNNCRVALQINSEHLLICENGVRSNVTA